MEENKTFRMTYLSVLFTPPKQLGESCRRVEKELGIKIDFVGFTKEECEDDPSLYEELLTKGGAYKELFDSQFDVAE